MNVNADPYDGIMALCDCLGKDDKARIADRLLLDLGSEPYVPALLAVREDVKHFVQHAPQATLSIMIAEIWHSLSEAEQTSTLAFFSKQRKGAENG